MEHSNLSLADRDGLTHRPLAPNDEQAIWTPIACGEGINMPGPQSTEPVTCPACLALEEDGVQPQPEQMINLPGLLAAQLGSSRAQVRRLIHQGALKLDGELVQDEDLPASRVSEADFQIGRREPFRLHE